MKCKCGVELFEKDIIDEICVEKDCMVQSSMVENIYNSSGMPIGAAELPYEYKGKQWQLTHNVFRCPKCFKTKKVKVK